MVNVKEMANKSEEISKEFKNLFIQHYANEGVPSTMTGITEFIVSIFQFGIEADKLEGNSGTPFNDLLSSGINLGINQIGFHISKIDEDEGIPKIPAHTNLPESEQIQLVKQIDHKFISLFIEAYTNTRPELAMAGLTTFLSNILTSSHYTSDEILSSFIKALNRMINDKGIELIVVTKE
jgi:hypothetical protein